MSPAGEYAASIILKATGDTPKSAFYRHEKSFVALLRIEGKTFGKVAEAEAGGLAECATFSPDGRYLHVGNFVDSDIDILRRRQTREGRQFRAAGVSGLDAWEYALRRCSLSAVPGRVKEDPVVLLALASPNRRREVYRSRSNERR
jgi:hypothetical protein